MTSIRKRVEKCNINRAYLFLHVASEDLYQQLITRLQITVMCATGQ